MYVCVHLHACHVLCLVVCMGMYICECMCLCVHIGMRVNVSICMYFLYLKSIYGMYALIHVLMDGLINVCMQM